VPKSGYRFIGEVKEHPSVSFTEEITHVEFEIEEEIESVTREQTRHAGATYLALAGKRIPVLYLTAASLVLICGAAAIVYFGMTSRSAHTDLRLPLIDGRKTVAVMFFENQSNSAELEWLREGLADMLVAGLSRSEGLTVLGRGQLHELLDRDDSGRNSISVEKAKELARQTQAEFFVTGSFAKIGERVRLDASLHEASTGNLLATETLTVERAEQILTEIDLISLKISNRLNAAPSGKNDLASVMTDNLEAYRYYSMGVEKAQALQNKEAIDLLGTAVALDPEFAMAHARIGYAYAVTWGQNDKGKPHLEKAFQLSDRLTEKDRMSITAWYSIANFDFPAAIRSYREIINRYPFEIEAYWRLGKLLDGESRSAEAIEVLRQGMTMDPESKDLYNQLGGILSRQGRHNEAIAAHERYVALAPNEPNAYDSLGLSFQWAGNYDKAIANYNRALDIDPSFEIAIVHLANTKFRLGQYRDSIAILQRYIDAAPSHNEKARGFDAMAYVYLRAGDLDLSQKYGGEAAKIRNDSLWTLYLVAAKRGDVNKSRNLEEVILKNLPTGDRGARVNLRFEPYYRGTIALENGRGDEAIEYFRQTITQAPTAWNIEDFEDCLGLAFLRLGRFNEAIAEFQRILQLNPNYPLVHFRLGEAYRSKGMADEARGHYSIFIELWSKADIDVPEVATAQKYLQNPW
jgi:tetratricopeptide (TPR) repeat protein